MRKYRVLYTCSLDEGYPPTSTVIKASSKEDARDRFFDTDDQDWEILEIKMIKEDSHYLSH